MLVCHTIWLEHSKKNLTKIKRKLFLCNIFISSNHGIFIEVFFSWEIEWIPSKRKRRLQALLRVSKFIHCEIKLGRDEKVNKMFWKRQKWKNLHSLFQEILQKTHISCKLAILWCRGRSQMKLKEKHPEAIILDYFFCLFLFLFFWFIRFPFFFFFCSYSWVSFCISCLQVGHLTYAKLIFRGFFVFVIWWSLSNQVKRNAESSDVEIGR